MNSTDTDALVDLLLDLRGGATLTDDGQIAFELPGDLTEARQIAEVQIYCRRSMRELRLLTDPHDEKIEPDEESDRRRMDAYHDALREGTRVADRLDCFRETTAIVWEAERGQRVYDIDAENGSGLSIRSTGLSLSEARAEAGELEADGFWLTSVSERTIKPQEA